MKNLLNSSSVDVITKCPGSKKAISEANSGVISDMKSRAFKIMDLPQDDDKEEIHGTWLHAVAANLIIAFLISLKSQKNLFAELVEKYKGLFGDKIAPVAPYVNYCRKLVKDHRGYGHLTVEHKIDLAGYGFMPGVVDFCLYDEHTQSLYIVDFKTGYRYVQCVDNLQLVLYALGIIDFCQNHHYHVENVSLTICQGDSPYEWCPSVSQLREIYAKRIQPALQSNDYHSGDHCSFCPCRESCLHRMEDELLKAYSLIHAQTEDGYSDLKELSDSDVIAICDSRAHIAAIMDISRRESLNRIHDHDIPGYTEKTKRECVPGTDQYIIAALNDAGCLNCDSSEIYTKPKLSLSAIDRKTGGKEKTAAILGDYVRMVPAGQVIKKK